MRRLFPLGLVLLVSACGSSSSNNNGDGGSGTDYAPPYVGAWTGTATLSADGEQNSATIDLPIEEVATNLIELQGLCSDTDSYSTGPEADVSATGFTVVAGGCSYSSTNCTQGDISYAWTDGTGTLTSGTLSATVDGTVTCGTLSVGFTLTFSSSQKGTYGSSTARNPGPGNLAATLSAAFR